MPLERTGLLIIRAWVENHSSRPLRAHIRLTTNVATGFEREVTLTEFSDVCAEVETWLQDVMATEQPL